MDGILSRTHQTTKYLKVDSQLVQPNKTVASIEAEINEYQGISRVKVKTNSSVLKELKFEFAITEFNQLEAAISQELGLPIEEIRKLMQIKQKTNSDEQ
nr:hypothetical protein [Dendronalium sp. ChiSLP03b]MDZ8206646.1 hypothetical protein [Dendronalium sp. ChiSLP03b]